MPNGYKTQLDVARARYRKVLRASCQPGQLRMNPLDQPAAVCAACSIGTFSNTTNALQCTPCAPGYYQPDLGKTECKKCQPGYIQPSIGQSSCSACPGFKYDDGTGTFCAQCPHGSYTTGAAVSKNDCVCQSGYVNTNGTCVSCPANGACCQCDKDPKKSWEIIEHNHLLGFDPCMNCLNGSSAAIPLPGHAVSDESVNAFYTCEPEDACLGGPPELSTCQTGYTGKRCGKCLDNYYADTNGHCLECGPVWQPVLMFIAFMICLCLVLVLTLIMTLMEEGTDGGAALLVYFQILDLTRRTRAIWPSQTAKILYISALFNLDLTYFRLDCITRVPTSVSQSLWLVSPIMVLLVLVIISGFIYMLRGHRKHLLRNPPLEWGYHAPYPFTWKDPFRKLFEVPDVEYWRIIKSWIIFCSFPMYPMLVSRSLLYFNCGLVLSDNTYSVLFLKELPYVKCGESEFMSLMKPSIVSFVCWCVIPPLVNAFFLVGFYKSRHTKEFYQAYWPLYKPYHADNIVWLSINLAFICLFHATTVVFKTTDDQMTAGSIVMLLEMAAVAWRRPWHEEFIAYLDLIQHGSILIFLMFARRITNDNIQEYDVLLSAIILVTIFALLFLMSWMLLHSIFPSFYLPKSLHRFNQIPTSELDIAESGSGSQKLRPQSTSQSPSPANFGANTFVAKENNKRVALRDRKDNILGTGSF